MSANPLLEKIIDRATESGTRRLKGSAFAQSLELTGVLNSPEFRRIKNIPRRQLIATKEMAHELSVALRKPGSDFELRPLQAALLVEAGTHGGLFGAAKTGAGKSVVAPLFPLVVDHKVALLVVPPSLKRELQERILPWLRKHFELKPFFVLSYAELSIEYVCPDCKTKKMTREQKRKRDCAACRAGILEAIGPDLIIGDEMHRLANAASGRRIKFDQYLKAHPRTVVVGESGTLLTKSLERGYSLLRYTHLFDCPIPHHYPDRKDWCKALDAKVEGERLQPGALLTLYDGDGICKNLSQDCTSCQGTGKLSRVVRARLGLRKRFVETEGFVASNEQDDVEAALVVKTVSMKLPPVVETALGNLRAAWITPDGRQIPDPIAFWRHARELLSGFYYRWVWPNDEPDYDWLEARKLWHQMVREIVKRRVQGLNTLMTVTNAVAHHPELVPPSLREDAVELLKEWDRIGPTQDPPTEAVWMDYFMVDYVAARAARKHREIVWYEDRALAEKLKERHPETLVLGAGRKDNERVSALAAGEGALDRALCLSIPVYHEGWNLQRWNEALVITPLTSGKMTEQLYSRQHREGQEADEVTIEVMVNSEEAWSAFDQALAQAKADYQLNGSPQKVLTCQPVGWKREF